MGGQRAGAAVRQFLQCCPAFEQLRTAVTDSHLLGLRKPVHSIECAARRKLVREVGDNFGWCVCFACAIPVLAALHMRLHRQPPADPTTVPTKLEISTAVVHELRAIGVEDTAYVPILFRVLPQRLHVLARMCKPIRHRLLGRTFLVPPDAWVDGCLVEGGAWKVAAVCASSSQQGCLYAYHSTDVLDQDKTIPEQCQWFSLRVVKGWLTNDSREARREANRHRLESGSDFEQDVSSEDYVADPESLDDGAAAGDSWGVPGDEANGADRGDSDDSLERGRHRRSRTPTPAGAGQKPPRTPRHKNGKRARPAGRRGHTFHGNSAAARRVRFEGSPVPSAWGGLRSLSIK